MSGAVLDIYVSPKLNTDQTNYHHQRYLHNDRELAEISATFREAYLPLRAAFKHYSNLGNDRSHADMSMSLNEFQVRACLRVFQYLPPPPPLSLALNVADVALLSALRTY